MFNLMYGTTLHNARLNTHWTAAKSLIYNEARFITEF